MTTKTERLRALCEAVKQWGNCNQAWFDQSEDVPAAVVGHINEDGNTYPVATIDCDQYYAAQDSIKLARHYAALNPAEVRAMLDLMGKMRDALKWCSEDVYGAQLQEVNAALAAFDQWNTGE